MEGLTFGWKKSTVNYHFFDKGSFSSVCIGASFHLSEFKVQEFLTEIELTPDTQICQRCYNLRKQDAIQQIKKIEEKINFFSHGTQSISMYHTCI